MRYLLAGASGFLGNALAADLMSDGHEVTRLVRGVPGGGGSKVRTAEVHWDPSTGHVAAALLAGYDVLIGLSGAGIGDKRWNERYKRTLLDSRVQPTHALATALAQLPDSDRPAAFISASAVGYYGDRGDQVLTESSPAGQGFLAELVVQWEAAAQPAVQAGVRTAYLRTGLVLAASGGLLKRLIPLYKLGAGGNLGSGRQYQPWITLADEIGAIRHIADTATLTGAVNLVAPNPVRNSVFSKALASALHRPSVVPAPAFALRIALGEFANEGVLAGQRVIPRALTESGYAFRHAELDTALEWALKH